MSIESQDQFRPVLDYATREADGLPAFHAEAEVAIDSGARPRDLRRFFRNADDTVRYFAKSMARKHGSHVLSNRCLACGAAEAGFVLQLTWKATCPPGFLEFRVSAAEIAAPFMTMHAVCGPCANDWAKRLTAYVAPRKWLSRTISGLLFLVFVGWLLSMSPAVGRNVRLELPGWAIWLLLAFFGAAYTASGVLYLLNYLQRPKVFRRMMPRDVKLFSIEGVFERQDGILRSLSD